MKYIVLLFSVVSLCFGGGFQGDTIIAKKVRSDSAFLTATKTTRLYYGIAKGDSCYSIKDTSKRVKTDSIIISGKTNSASTSTGVFRCKGGGEFDSSLFVNKNIGISVNPTARLHIAAGTATASTAPLKFTNGTLLGTPEAGTFEFSNEKPYFTCVGTQRVLDRTSDVKLTSDTVVNSDVETTVYTALIPANSLRIGNILKLNAVGHVDETSAADLCTLKVKFGTTTMASIISPGTGTANQYWHIKGNATIRTIGGTGLMAWHLDMDVGGTSVDAGDVSVVDFTTSENVTVTATWNNAKVGNIFICDQGYMEYKN